jgi:S-DNA-T family DNA segregation ATPase FtsK/SpoIIIE
MENGGPEEVDSFTFGTHISSSSDSLNSDKDELYNEAVKTVCELRGASASMLQRRLKIGYNRAANLIDQLEANNIVGAAQGSKMRKVII